MRHMVYVQCHHVMLHVIAKVLLSSTSNKVNKDRLGDACGIHY